MAGPYVARLVGWTTGCALAPLVLGAMLGRRWAAIGILIAVLATLWLVAWLPRAAHRAFATGRFERARWRYRLLAATAFSRDRARAALLSCAGCDAETGRLEDAGRALAGLDAPALALTERVVWLNNRACVDLAAGGDPAAALALVDEAVALRPDVPAIQHTRARALLAVGRIEDAIAVLDAMRAGGELPPHLEAERCRELATAWARRGEPAYADDYRARARLIIR